MKDNNIGKTGADSLRVDGMQIGNLPLGQGNEAKEGLADFLETHHETLRNNVAAKFPKHKVEYLKSRIKECEGNIQKIKDFKQDLKTQISEYRSLIKEVALANEQILKLDPEQHKEQIKKIRKKTPPYNVEALNKQIEQFEESIERCDATIEQDYDSISEIREVLALAEQRDKELRNIQK